MSRGLGTNEEAVSPIVGTVLLSAVAVVILGAFGATVLSTVGEDITPPSATFSVGGTVGDRFALATFVAGTSFPYSDARFHVAANDAGTALDWYAISPQTLGRLAPGDLVRVNFTASAPTIAAGTRLSLIVTDSASGRLVALASATIPGAVSPAPIAQNAIAIPTGTLSPATVIADGARVTNLTAGVTSSLGLGLVKSVTVDLTPVGGSRTATLVDDGASLDAIAGDGTYFLQFAPARVSADASASLVVTATDVTGKAATRTVVLTLTAPTGGGGGGGSNAPPIASFTFTTAGWSVAVDASASSDPESGALNYTWSWDDGSPTSYGVTATHTFPSTASRAVTLTVRDPGGATGTQARIVSLDGNTWFACPPTSTVSGTIAICSNLLSETDSGAVATLSETSSGNPRLHQTTYTGVGYPEAGRTHSIVLRAARGASGENLLLQVWDGATWTTAATVTSGTMTTWPSFTLSDDQWNLGQPLVRLADAQTVSGSGSDTGTSTWTVDWMKVTTS